MEHQVEYKNLSAQIVPPTGEPYHLFCDAATGEWTTFFTTNQATPEAIAASQANVAPEDICRDRRRALNAKLDTAQATLLIARRNSTQAQAQKRLAEAEVDRLTNLLSTL